MRRVSLLIAAILALSMILCGDALAGECELLKSYLFAYEDIIKETKPGSPERSDYFIELDDANPDIQDLIDNKLVSARHIRQYFRSIQRCYDGPKYLSGPSCEAARTVRAIILRGCRGLQDIRNRKR